MLLRNDEFSEARGGSCDDIRATGPFITEGNVGDWAERTLGSAFVCLDGKGYWLIMRYDQECSRDGSICTPDALYMAPPGVAKLDGKSFGGLTLTDLVAR